MREPDSSRRPRPRPLPLPRPRLRPPYEAGPRAEREQLQQMLRPAGAGSSPRPGYVERGRRAEPAVSHDPLLHPAGLTFKCEEEPPPGPGPSPAEQLLLLPPPAAGGAGEGLEAGPAEPQSGGSTYEEPASPPPRLSERTVRLRGKRKRAVDDMFAEMCRRSEEHKAIQRARLEQEERLMERFLEHEKTQREQDRQLLERLISAILSRPQPACPCQRPGME